MGSLSDRSVTYENGKCGETLQVLDEVRRVS